MNVKKAVRRPYLTKKIGRDLVALGRALADKDGGDRRSLDLWWAGFDYDQRQRMLAVSAYLLELGKWSRARAIVEVSNGASKPDGLDPALEADGHLPP